MFERIRRGWELAKASAAVLSADRELLVFPLLSGLASIVVMASFAIPLVGSELFASLGSTGGKVTAGLVTWAFYFVMALVTIFFNTALVGAALERLDGGDPTVASGLRVATSRFGSILGWAALSATVGLLLKIAQNKSNRLGKIVVSLVGLAWNLATFLVVPVLAARGLGPIEAVKESGSLLRKTWGEQIVGTGGISIIQGLVIFGLAIVGVPAVVLTAASAPAWVVGVVVAVLAVTIVMVILVGSALQGVYTAALYRYATKGVVGQGFAAESLASAFVPR